MNSSTALLRASSGYLQLCRCRKGRRGASGRERRRQQKATQQGMTGCSCPAQTYLAPPSRTLRYFHEQQPRRFPAGRGIPGTHQAGSRTAAVAASGGGGGGRTSGGCRRRRVTGNTALSDHSLAPGRLAPSRTVQDREPKRAPVELHSAPPAKCACCRQTWQAERRTWCRGGLHSALVGSSGSRAGSSIYYA